MRFSIPVVILLLLSFLFMRPAFSQRASDPNVVDLTNDLIEIDSLGQNESLFPPINVGDVNGDNADDILLTRSHVDSIGHATYYTKVVALSLSGAGPSWSDTSVAFTRLATDFDGDGRKDIVTASQNEQVLTATVHWGVPAPKLFTDSLTTGLVGPFGDNAVPMLTGDYVGDGAGDVFSFTSGRGYLYRGTLHDRSILNLVASDSLAPTNTTYLYKVGQALGNFAKKQNPQLAIATSGWINSDQHTAIFRILLYPNAHNDGGPDLWHSTPAVIYEDAIKNSDLFVYSTPILSYDITGDGIDDLLVCDSAHIYIFKGGPNFGSTKLTKQTADFVITSPALLDPANFKGSVFASSIFGAGRLQGSSEPYLGVIGTIDSAGIRLPVTYLYAGGDALDTYYDGVIYHTEGEPAAVVNSSGILVRNSLVFEGRFPDHLGYYLLQKGTETLPHKRFESVDATQPTEPVKVRYLSGHQVELAGVDRLKVTAVTNILGAAMNLEVNSISSRQLILDLAGYPAGVYFAKVQSAGSENLVKLLR
jgi:hypothetical protein